MSFASGQRRSGRPGATKGRYLAAAGLIMALLHTGRTAASGRRARENLGSIGTGAVSAEGSSVRRATQVQARTQHIAAGAGQIDSLLEVTHGPI